MTDFEVRLWRGDSSALVADFSGLVPGPDGLLPPIPAGDYRARVTFPDGGAGGDHLAIDTRAIIVKGGRAVLQLGSQAGGRLFFRIESRLGRDVPVDITLDTGLGRRQVGDLFEPASGRSVPLRLGASGLSARIAAGSYRLRAT
ncbi:MAG: hypothetical protein NXI31_27255 [bacterium]|nr:hypothetical protein [bacterium]